MIKKKVVRTIYIACDGCKQEMVAEEVKLIPSLDLCKACRYSVQHLDSLELDIKTTEADIRIGQERLALLNVIMDNLKGFAALLPKEETVPILENPGGLIIKGDKGVNKGW